MKYNGKEISPIVKRDVFVCHDNCDGHRDIDGIKDVLHMCKHQRDRVCTYDVLCLPAIRAMREENERLKAKEIAIQKIINDALTEGYSPNIVADTLGFIMAVMEDEGR